MGNSTLLIGMHVSGQTLQAALVDASGQIIQRREDTLSPENIIEQAAFVVRELSANRGEISALGFAIPGLVNRQTDVVIMSRDLPASVREGLHSELGRATGLRVELENDANAAAYGEFKVGAGKESRDIFYMMIGNGIGGAIILDGKLWTGSSGFAGEVGHITIDAEGLECICGNTGCLETVASAPSIVRRARERLDCVFDVGGGRDGTGHHFDCERRRGGFCSAKEVVIRGCLRVGHKSHALKTRRDFLEHRQPLANDASLVLQHAGKISARPSEARDEA